MMWDFLFNKNRSNYMNQKTILTSIIMFFIFFLPLRNVYANYFMQDFQILKAKCEEQKDLKEWFQLIDPLVLQKFVKNPDTLSSIEISGIFTPDFLWGKIIPQCSSKWRSMIIEYAPFYLEKTQFNVMKNEIQGDINIALINAYLSRYIETDSNGDFTFASSYTKIVLENDNYTFDKRKLYYSLILRAYETAFSEIVERNLRVEHISLADREMLFNIFNQIKLIEAQNLKEQKRLDESSILTVLSMIFHLNDDELINAFIPKFLNFISTSHLEKKYSDNIYYQISKSFRKLSEHANDIVIITQNVNIENFMIGYRYRQYDYNFYEKKYEMYLKIKNNGN